MENLMMEKKKELIEWINDLDDLAMVQKILNLKNNVKSSSLISDINSEPILKNDFDEQFAAGMTSEELLENIATHLKSIDSEESSAVVSDIEAEYAVKDDFDERFAKGISSEESRKRTHAFIESLPWKK
ncbi:MAG: hypothetical protein ACOH1X_12015 [Kaistella sp.]